MGLGSEVKMLIGCRMTRCTRVLDMIGLYFRSGGAPDHFPARCDEPYGLHVQCGLRILREGKIVVCSEEMYRPAFPDQTKDFHYDTDQSVLDQTLRTFIDANRDRKIVFVKLYACGDLVARFDDGSVLHVYLNATNAEDEAWRFMSGKGSPHLIASGEGLEYSEVPPEGRF